MKTVKIFLIDDDNIFVFLTKKTIELANLQTEVSVFGDGKAAIDFFYEHAHDKESHPDVIFLDLNMPIMDGWEFLNDYTALEKDNGNRIPIYLVSSTISPHDIERAKSCPAVTDFFVKPLEKEQIVEVIKNL